jgi:hypothetical protein
MRSTLVAVLSLVGLLGCGSSPEVARPVVGEIPVAIGALETRLGAGLEYFEVSADLRGVTMVLAETEQDSSGEPLGMYATTFRWEGGELTSDGETLSAEGATFQASAIEINSESLFEQIDDELSTPVIVDVAIQGTGTGSTVIDATVVNEKGGTLLVLLSGDGRILGVQAS